MVVLLLVVVVVVVSVLPVLGCWRRVVRAGRT
jgi:hypothetical protein